MIEQAEGDASRFRQIVAEYSKAPQVTRDRLYIEAMQQIMANTSKVLVDQKGGNNLLYLPLDKLMQMAGTRAAPRAPKPRRDTACRRNRRPRAAAKRSAAASGRRADETQPRR